MKKPIITIYFVECYYGVIPNDLAHKGSKEGILRKMMIRILKVGGNLSKRKKKKGISNPGKSKCSFLFHPRYLRFSLLLNICSRQ